MPAVKTASTPVASLNVTPEVVEAPIGSTNGESALLSGLTAVPVEPVNLGVAKAGEATTTTADANTNATSTPALRVLMLSFRAMFL
jgi:hypothetical protein